MVTCLIMVALGTGTTCSDGPETPCPDRWIDDPVDGCQADPDYLDDLRGTIGTGAYGFAWQATGNCAPGRGCAARDCTYALASDLDIVAYNAEDIVEDTTQDGLCLRAFGLVGGAQPAGNAITSEDGAYAFTLPIGRYALTATDPVDGCPFLAGHADITTDQALGRVLFGFDHAAQ